MHSNIATELGVPMEFEATSECERRIEFLKTYLRAAELECYVLGISGGVDSTTAGRLAQLAVERLRQERYDARFIAVRLPYGAQLDELDAQRALEFVRPDDVRSLNIKPASDETLQSLRRAGVTFKDELQEDFILGNVKARQRMIVQYAIAGANRGLVIGTDHAAEAVMGFFTKHGDGACDVAPLTGLSKRRVRQIATLLGAPAELTYKEPTADLESLSPQKPDEAAYGVSYEAIDAYLEGKPVRRQDAAIIEAAFLHTQHKRRLPAHPSSNIRVPSGVAFAKRVLSSLRRQRPAQRALNVRRLVTRIH